MCVCVLRVMHVDNTGYISFNHSTSYVLGMARTVYICTVYDRVISDFPAKNTVYTPYIHGSGQPYLRARHGGPSGDYH